MLKIWGRKTSSNVQKVLWCCEELHLPFERIDAGREFGGLDEEAYLALNPNGLIPTLQDDETVIWESNAILRYLARRYPDGDRLYPADPAAAAAVDQWLDWQLTVLGPAISPLFWQLIRTAEAERSPAVVAQAQTRCAAAWTLLDGELQNRDYVAADRLTLADLALGSHIYRWRKFDIERPQLPALAAWYARIELHHGFKRYVAGPLV